MLDGLAMDQQAMNDMLHASLPDILAMLTSAAVWIGAGAALGAAYFLSLRWNAALFAEGRGVLAPLALQLGRFALAAAALGYIAMQFGALPLLATTLGLLGARGAVLAWSARQ